ncbi:MAG: allantoinase AllB [Saprospiraceae bacterium]
MTKIYSQRCWVDHKFQPATICFNDGIITDIVFDKQSDALDYKNLVIMPGVIDAHVHVNEPGRTEWEGFETATIAAAAGGTTTIVDMPLNASPVTTTLSAFMTKLDASEGKLNVNCGFYGGLIPGNVGEMEGLIQAGVIGIKCFLTHSGIDDFPNVTEKELDEAMPILAKYGIPLLAHCELVDDTQNELEKHPKSYQAYLASRPKKWENEAIALIIRMCRKYDCPVHIVHVSSAEALGMITEAKKEGLPITAETCAQYLYFNAEDIPDGQTIYKCAPPIREQANNNLLKKALVDGVLDFITTDHSPAPASIKEIESGNLKKAWGGIAGIQFLLSASWTALKDEMTLEQFIPLLTEKPADFIYFANKKGSLSIGHDADIVIWDPEVKFEVSEEHILFRHKISPYLGTSLYGQVHQTIINGEIVFKDKMIIQKNKGKWLIQQ